MKKRFAMRFALRTMTMLYRFFGPNGFKFGAGRRPDGEPGLVVACAAVFDFGTEDEQVQPLVQIVYDAKDGQAFLDQCHESFRSEDWVE